MEMSKPRPILSDMPLHIKQIIADHTDPISKCALRRCSRDLRLVVDRSKSFYRALDVKATDTEVCLEIDLRDDNELEIGKKSNRRKWIYYTKKDPNNCLVNRKLVEGMNYIQRAAADLALMLQNPETEMEILFVNRPMDLEVLQHAFGNSNHKLNVNCVAPCFLRTETILRVLSYIEPGTLQTLDFHRCDLRENTTRLLESEHWKQAVSLESYPYIPFPLVSMLHFRSVLMARFYLKPKDAKFLIKTFLDRGEEFESWTLTNYSKNDPCGASNYLTRRYPRLKPDDPFRWHIKIPATPYHLEVSREIHSMSWSFVKILSSQLNEVDVQ